MDIMFFSRVKGIFPEDDINLYLHVSATRYVMYALEFVKSYTNPFWTIYFCNTQVFCTKQNSQIYTYEHKGDHRRWLFLGQHMQLREGMRRFLLSLESTYRLPFSLKYTSKLWSILVFIVEKSMLHSIYWESLKANDSVLSFNRLTSSCFPNYFHSLDVILLQNLFIK